MIVSFIKIMGVVSCCLFTRELDFRSRKKGKKWIVQISKFVSLDFLNNSKQPRVEQMVLQRRESLNLGGSDPQTPAGDLLNAQVHAIHQPVESWKILRARSKHAIHSRLI